MNEISNMSKTKKIGMGIGATITLTVIVYSLFWFWVTDQIKEEIAGFMLEAKQKDIQIMTRSMGVTGFPSTHKIHFSGRVQADGAILEIPMLEIHSSFLPGAPLTLEAPQGLAILKPAVTEIWSLDRMRIDTEVPATLPADLTREDLTAWKQAEGHILLKNMELHKDSLYLKASGKFELDHMLQPAGEFQARITGHMAFLRWLQDKKHIETREALLATAVLSGLSKKDANETYINIDLSLQNQTLFVGPLRLARLPAIQWGWRNTGAQ